MRKPRKIFLLGRRWGEIKKSFCNMGRRPLADMNQAGQQERNQFKRLQKVGIKEDMAFCKKEERQGRKSREKEFP